VRTSEVEWRSVIHIGRDLGVWMRKKRLSVDWDECGQKTEYDIIHATSILFLNNLANPFVVPSVIATKYTIFDNLSHTTGIAFFPTTNSSFVMKFTDMSMIFLGFYLPSKFLLVSLFYSPFFNIDYSHLYISLYL